MAESCSRRDSTPILRDTELASCTLGLTGQMHDISVNGSSRGSTPLHGAILLFNLTLTNYD